MAPTVDQLHPADDVDTHGALDAIAVLQPVIREFQAETERGARIPPALVAQLRAAGLYRMAAPLALGGLQLDVLDLLRVVELASEADGSVGWNLINNSTNQLAALALPDEGVAELFGDRPDPIIAGTVVPGGGRAREVPGGYVVSGRWRFGSGCQEAQWCISNFSVFDGDEPRRGSDGTQRLWRSFYPRAEVTVHETWHVTGMRGTGSHDWSVDEVFVPARRTLPLPPTPFTNQWQRWEGTLYQLPVQAILGPHHSVVATGIARAAIDELRALASTKVPRGRSTLLRDEFQVQEAMARAEAVLCAGQAFRGQLTAELWDTVAAGQPTSIEQRARCRLASVYAVDCARAAMDLMFRAGGSTSNQQGQRLEQCWRDLNVVCQAATNMPEWYPVTGRVLLGLPADPRLG